MSDRCCGRAKGARVKQGEEMAESFEPHLKSSAPMLLDDCERLQMMGILHARKPSTSVSHRAAIRDHAELSGLCRHHRAAGFLGGGLFRGDNLKKTAIR